MVDKVAFMISHAAFSHITVYAKTTGSTYIDFTYILMSAARLYYMYGG